MTKQLFLREVTYRSYVYMDPDEECKDEYDREIISDAIDPDDDSLTPVMPGDRLLFGFSEGTLVYHEDCYDLTIREALARRGE